VSDTPRDVARGNENKDIDFPDDSPREVSLGCNTSPQKGFFGWDEGPAEWRHGHAVVFPKSGVLFHPGHESEGGSGISATDEWRCSTCSGGATVHKEFVVGCAHEDVQEFDIIECFKPQDCFATKGENGEVCVYVAPDLVDPGIWLVCWSDCCYSTEDEVRYVWHCRREEAEDPCDQAFMREISS
jgi:hypothetical protein